MNELDRETLEAHLAVLEKSKIQAETTYMNELDKHRSSRVAEFGRAVDEIDAKIREVKRQLGIEVQGIPDASDT